MIKVEWVNGWHADVEPAFSKWLPWPGRTSRWWFEVIGPGDDPDGIPTHYWTHDGGAFTLRRCLLKADEAVFRAWKENNVASP